ncbi:MAG: hypothetical protein HY205_01905, partial [Nitrospirae bacterium]|nr:hypothetical protein [Nitrospirota bacterium]
MNRFTRATAVLLLALVLWLMAGQQVGAYEEVTVTDGGTISGAVSLVGQVPKPKGYNLTTLPDPLYCGRISDGQG